MARGRPRIHKNRAECDHAYYQRKRLAALAPDAVCRTFGSCTLYCSTWELLYPLLPRDAAVVTDPPYQVNYDYTKTRRRRSHWDRNYAGLDQDLDRKSVV